MGKRLTQVRFYIAFSPVNPDRPGNGAILAEAPGPHSQTFHVFSSVFG